MPLVIFATIVFSILKITRELKIFLRNQPQYCLRSKILPELYSLPITLGGLKLRVRLFTVYHNTMMLLRNYPTNMLTRHYLIASHSKGTHSVRNKPRAKNIHVSDPGRGGGSYWHVQQSLVLRWTLNQRTSEQCIRLFFKYMWVFSHM